MKRTTKRTVTWAAVLLLACVAYVFLSGVDAVNVRTWNIDAGSGALPPELADDELAVPWLRDRPSFGIAFSGGGIRSATINLGIAQALHQRSVFDHVDYMSTVSGGGYLGASISTLMRKKSFVSEVDGRVHLGEIKDGMQHVEVVSEKAGACKYRVPCTISLDLQEGQQVPSGRSLIKIQEPSAQRGNLRERFEWRVRPGAFLREMSSRLELKGGKVVASRAIHPKSLDAHAEDLVDRLLPNVH